VLIKNLPLLALLFTGCSTMAGSPCSSQIVNYGTPAFSVDVAKYSARSSSTKSLLILPPTGGTNFIDRSYARTFCHKGYDVYILNSWTEQTEKTTELEIHQRFYSHAQQAINAVLNHVATPFVGVLGTSVGALHASVAASTNERINAVLSIVGGTPIAEVIVGSDQEAMRSLRSARVKRYGFKNAQENIEAIGRAFHLEPMAQGEIYKKKSLGMVLAESDQTVPYETQVKLRDFWHPQKVITLSNGHFWAIVKTWLFHTGELVDFFEESVLDSRNHAG
jgi:hypothetical protein